MNPAAPSPSSRILSALAAELALAELTLATRFAEMRSPTQLLQLWQIDERIRTLLARAGAPRRPLSIRMPDALANSLTYRAIEGSAVGFLVQFAALCAWHDEWGRQALLAYPNSTHSLWRALVWAGTGYELTAGFAGRAPAWPMLSIASEKN